MRTARMGDGTPARPPGSRLARLLDILRLTGSGDGWTAPRLAEHFKVSRRRLFEDLALLHQAGFPVVAERSGYHPLRRDLQMPVTLSIPEVISLLYPVASTEDSKRAARMKLSARLPGTLRKLFTPAERVRMQTRSAPIGPGIYEAVERSLSENRRLALRYGGLRDEAARDRVVEPQMLFMQGTGWYLAAWAPERGDFRLFRLDRIESAKVLDEAFEPRDGFDIEQYLGVGVWKGRALDAEVEVLASHVKPVKSEALARGFPFRKSAAGAVLEIPRGHLDETAWWLAQFGEGVRVVRPPELRARLAAIGRRIVELNG
ncbi:MAG: WYL domain-containing protein [Planctomycetes bacterium]|nr:WYL domain-containing protein [Planctomycetota bacterium]